MSNLLSFVFPQQIYNLSGYPEFVKKHGLLYSYQLAPRAEIFRRDQGKVVNACQLIEIRYKKEMIIHEIGRIIGFPIM